MRKSSVVLLLLVVPFLLSCSAINETGYQDQVVVLMYHHLDPTESSSSTISPEKFASHLKMLSAEGFNIIPMEQLGAFLAGTGEVPPNALVITFDDGYESNYEYAFPVLKKYGFPATIFMIVSRIGRWEGEIPKLSWDQMQEMLEHQISFQSHSFDGHYTVPVDARGEQRPVLAVEIFDAGTNSKEKPEARRLRVYEDLKKSKELLEEKLGEPVEYLAAPYGWYDQVTIEAAQEAGFRYIFTIKPGANQQDTDPTRLFRVNAGSPQISAAKLKEHIFQAVR